MKMVMTFAAALLMACGGGGDVEPADTTETPAETAQPVNRPDDPWAGWKDSFTNVSKDKWVSKTHGKRFVEIWVNDVALAAYKDESAEMPVGSVLVKPSWDNDNGQPGGEGPLFVMVKKEPGYAGGEWEGDWYYAFIWENPTGQWKEKLGGPTRWESKSGKVEYCWDCHDVEDRQLGMPPEDQRAW